MADLPRKMYLAGPMSGYAGHNFPLFNQVAAELRQRGHDVFNPAENKDDGMRKPRSFYMWLDIPALMKSEAVVVLPGWEKSRGANLEVWLAIDLDIPVYRCTTGDDGVILERVADLEPKVLPFEEVAVRSAQSKS